MRITLIGGAGQLGQALLSESTDFQMESPAHDELDITDEQAVADYLNDRRPDAVINTAAFHDVPRCEREPLAAFAVNAIGPRALARACRAIEARLFHISTDYVFDGQKGHPYREEDLPAPLMIYGAAKLAGEQLALATWPRTTILRTTGLFGTSPCRAKPSGHNFVELMRHLAQTRDEVKVVADQWSCPTSAHELARQLVHLLHADSPPGIYHAVNSPGCSWYEFAEMIFERAGISTTLSPVGSDHFPAPFRRPRDSRLHNGALSDAGLNVMGSLEQALDAYFAASNC